MDNKCQLCKKNTCIEFGICNLCYTKIMCTEFIKNKGNNCYYKGGICDSFEWETPFRVCGLCKKIICNSVICMSEHIRDHIKEVSPRLEHST